MAITRQMFESLQPGVNAITQGRNEANRATQEAALRQYLQRQKEGSIDDQGKYTPGTQAQAQQLQDKTKQDAFNDMVQKSFPNGLPPGSGVTSPLGGGVTKGYNLNQLGMQNKKAEQQAYQTAANAYQHGVASNATSVQALHTILNALQSNDSSSMGQIRTGLVLGNGFKRYNDNEGVALTPDDKQADVSGLLGKFGISTKDATLSDVTRSNVVRWANGKLDELQDAHNTLKSQAQNIYSNSQFSDPTKAANLGTMLGAPVDQQLQQMKQSFSQFHNQANLKTPAQGSNAPSQGLSGYFRGLGSALMGGGQSAPAAQTQQAPQTSDPGYQRYQQLLQKAGAGQ